MPRLVVTLLIAALAGCGGPALQNAPRPDPGIVAGIAAGVAGAATLADPNAAGKRQEQKKPQQDKRPVKTKVHVPGEVLDRLDEKQANPGAEPEAVAPAPAETSAVKSPIPLK
jgi:hypothetical protein